MYEEHIYFDQWFSGTYAGTYETGPSGRNQPAGKSGGQRRDVGS
jgi:hypothetical protein